MLAIGRNYNNIYPLRRVNYFTAESNNDAKTIAKIISAIDKADTIAILPHVNPDLDALGSAAALAIAIKNKYPAKEVNAYLAGAISKECEGFIKKYPGIFLKEQENKQVLRHDLAIAVDCDYKGRIGEENIGILEQAKTNIKIDHHEGKNDFGDIKFVDPTATSNTQLVLKVAEKLMDGEINPEVGRAIYAGIVTDTDGFKTFKGDPAGVFEDCAKVCKTGFKVQDVNKLVNSMSLDDFKAYQAMVTGTKFRHGDRIAWFVDEKRTRPESDNLLDMLKEINGVKIAVRFTPDKISSETKVSLKGSEGVDHKEIVSRIRTDGKTLRKSGFSMSKDTTYKDILDKIEKELHT